MNMSTLPKPKIGLPESQFARRVGVRLFILAVFILISLPFWTIFQDLLTRAVMSVGWYRSLQNIIVPYELRIVGSVLTAFGLPIRAGQAYIEWPKPNGQNEVIYLIWNCVGWQTFILFVVTLITGLSGKHTVWSKFEALLVGLLGTYLVNIFRLVTIILVYMVVGRPLGVVFHDYFSNILSLAWLFGFWWFVYKFVLEERGTHIQKQANKV